MQRRCPITAVVVMPAHGNISHELLLVGTGPMLQIFKLHSSSIEVVCLDQVFQAEKVHGIRILSLVPQIQVLVFGTFSVVVFTVCSSLDGRITCHRALDLSPAPIDMILDGLSIDRSIVLGHGQNFLSVYDISTGASMGLARSSVICVLFSLSFGNTNGSGIIPVASGTALGDIYLWNFNFELPRDVNSAPYEPEVKLSGHEGVVCKVCWNKDNSRVASVSDDRTVRLWDAASGSALFIGWGHTCRVWDVTFRGDKEGQLITSGEDLALKLWSVETSECLCTMEGHVGRNVWCIAYSSASDCVISGGNDSSVKLWVLDTQMSLSPETTVQSDSVQTAHVIPNVSSVDMSDVLRGEVAAALKLSYQGNELYLVTQAGRVIVAPLEHLLPSSRGNLFSRFGTSIEYMLETTSPVHTADLNSQSNDSFSYLLCGHVDGSATVAIIKDGVLLGRRTWKAHVLRAIGAWIIDTGATWISGVTATVAGAFKLWRIDFIVGGDNVTICNVACVSELTTKKQIASCATRITGLSSPFHAGGVLVGGCKGAVCLFNRHLCNPEEKPADGTTFPPTFSIAHVHGHEKVCRIETTPNGFVSCSNNGAIYVHILSSEGFINCASLDPGMMTCCEMLFSRASWSGMPTSDVTYDPLYACGFQGNLFRIWDIRGKYELMKVEAGGWKRMHDCVVVPSEKAGPFYPDRLCFVSLDVTRKVPNLSIHSIRTSSAAETLPMYIRQSSNGRVMYSGVFIIEGRLFVAGGEEGVIKVFSVPQMDVIQEIKLPEECPIRTICTDTAMNETNKDGIVVAAGGRLSFAVWTFNEIALESASAISSLAPVLQFGAAGEPPKNATQDHRILCSACWFAHHDGTYGYYIILGDSRGCARLFHFCSTSSKLLLIWEHRVSDYPLLSCAVVAFEAKSNTTFMSLGDTTGFVYVFFISKYHTMYACTVLPCYF